MKHVRGIVAALVVLLVPALANANDRERASALLDEGNVLLRDGDPEAAILRFEEAMRVYDSPKIHVNLAEAHRAAKDFPMAMRHYEAFIARGTSKPAVLKRIEARAAEIEEQIGRIELVGSLEGATVAIDRWEAPWREGWRIPVRPGVRRVVVTREAMAPFDRRVEVGAGGLVRLSVSLSEPPPSTPPINLAAQHRLPEPEVVATTDAKDDLVTNEWFWVGVGGVVVVVAIVVVAATTGGDDRLPMGELPSTSTSEWGRP